MLTAASRTAALPPSPVLLVPISVSIMRMPSILGTDRNHDIPLLHRHTCITRMKCPVVVVIGMSRLILRFCRMFISQRLHHHPHHPTSAAFDAQQFSLVCFSCLICFVVPAVGFTRMVYVLLCRRCSRGRLCRRRSWSSCRHSCRGRPGLRGRPIVLVVVVAVVSVVVVVVLCCGCCPAFVSVISKHNDDGITVSCVALSACRLHGPYMVVISMKTLRLLLLLLLLRLAVLLVLRAVVPSSQVCGRGRGPLLGALRLPVCCFRGSGAVVA